MFAQYLLMRQERSRKTREQSKNELISSKSHSASENASLIANADAVEKGRVYMRSMRSFNSKLLNLLFQSAHRTSAINNGWRKANIRI